MTNKAKRGYLKSRLYTMITHLNGIKKDLVQNGIYFLSENCVNVLPLVTQWKQVLKHFQCDHIVARYGNKFPIDWLKLYLLDITFTNVIHVSNNNLVHYHLNSTKKRRHNAITSKSLNVMEYVSSNIGPRQNCIIHGVSSALKTLTDSPDGRIKVSKSFMKDDDVLDYIDILENNVKAQKLSQVIRNISVPKEMDKIVFGDEIINCIKEGRLEVVYCSPNVNIYDRVSIDESTFDVVIVKSFNKSDVGYTLQTSYGGMIGVTYW
jgi:hypothetical protein